MKSGLCIAVFYIITVFSLCQGQCIQHSCMKSSLFVACTYCNSSGGELYGFKQIITNKELVKIFGTVVDKEGPMWINDKESVCLTSDKEQCIGHVAKTNGAFSNVSCSDEFHFFCYHNNDSKCETCAESTTKPTTTTTATTASSTLNLTSTSTVNASQKGPNQKALIIFLVVGIVCLVAIISGVVCFLIKRRSNVTITEVGEEKSMYVSESQGDEISKMTGAEVDPSGDETTHV